MKSRLALPLALLWAGCGQQLVEFSRSPDGGEDLGVGDLTFVQDFSGIDQAEPNDDLTFPFDLEGDMTAPCHVLALDGVHALVTAAAQSADNPTGAVTVEAWVYLTQPVPNGAVIAGHYGNPEASTASYLLALDATSHPVFTVTPAANGTGSQSVTSSQVVGVNTWTHVAGQLTPGLSATISVFIDNVSHGDKSVGVFLFPAQVNGLPLHIGRNTTQSAMEMPFPGYMHDVRYSSVARYPSATPIPVRLVPDGSTIALYHFDEQSGSNAADASSHNVVGALLQNAMFAVPPVCP